MSRLSRVKIQGECPHCGAKDTVSFSDHYYYGEKVPHYIDLPTCSKCYWDEIRVRKINNRRYKVHEIQWDEYYESLDKYKDYKGDE